MNGSNAPVITNALVAWPPPPSFARFGGSPPSSARPRLSYAQPRSSQPASPFGSPPLVATTLPGALPPLSFPGASPLGGYGLPRASTDDLDSPGAGASTPSRALSLKGKERQRDYPSPKAPLSPAQLARIASSFGIHVPAISDANRKDLSRSSSPVISVTGAVGTGASTVPGHVVAVIPPVSLLAPVPGADAASERERARRWRRGRLVPLQPTLGAMLVAIAREFGLPSTQGVNVYLGTDGGRGSISSADDEPGPQITPATWTTLFAHAASTTSASQRDPSESPTSTPSSTPRKHPRTTFGGMMSTSTATRQLPQHTANKSLSSAEHDDEGPSRSSSLQSSSASSFSPRTPVSLGALSSSLPVFGTVEFDIDPQQAHWLDDWMRSGGPARRYGAGVEVLAVRELTLVERLNDPRPKFMRQMEEERERAERKAAEREAAAQREALRLKAEQEEAARDAARLVAEQEEAAREAEEAAREAEEAAREAEAAAERDEQEAQRQLAESAQITQFALDNDMIRSSIVEPSNDRAVDLEIDVAASRFPKPPQLLPLRDLASPITLSHSTSGGLLSPASPLSSGGGNMDHRASGIVMADQLNTLEKMMRDLSPREIRYNGRSPTSPGKDGKSPTPINLKELPQRGSSRLPYLQPDGAQLSRNGTESTTRTHGSTSADNPTSPDRAAWPAVPFSSIQSPDSPGLQEYFNKGAVSPDVVVSPPAGKGENGIFARAQASESASRSLTAEREREMREARRERAERDRIVREERANAAGGAAAERPKSVAPRRPARPPTPDLTTPDLPSHVLPAELVDAIKNSPSPVLPPVPVLSSLPGLPSRAPSSRARRISAKVLRPKERAHAYVVANSRDGVPLPGSGHGPNPHSRESSSQSADEPIGILPGLPTSYRSPPTILSEIGAIEEIVPMQTGTSVSAAPIPAGARGSTSGAPGGNTDKHGHGPGFTSRFFSFGSKRRDENAAAAAGTAPSGAGGDKRLTIQHISAPLPTSVKHHQVSAADLGMGMGMPSSASASTLASMAPAQAPTATTTATSAATPSPGSLTPNDTHRASLPNSPTSLRNVRRKPVPGVEGQRDSVDSASPHRP